MNLKRAKKIKEEIAEIVDDFPYVVLEFFLDSGIRVSGSYTKSLEGTSLPWIILNENYPLNLNEVASVKIADDDF